MSPGCIEYCLTADYVGGLVLVSESLLVVGAIAFLGGDQASFVRHEFLIIHVIACP